MAAATLAELRQQGFRHTNKAEDVGLVHRHKLGFGYLFYGARSTIAGVVDQHIHMAELRQRLLNRGLDDIVLARAPRLAKARIDPWPS